MPLDTISDNRIPVHFTEEATAGELHRLGQNAARQRPAHETKKFKKDETPIPREAKVGFAIGAGILVLCAASLIVPKLLSRPEPVKTVVPAITAPAPKPPESPEQETPRSE